MGSVDTSLQIDPHLTQSHSEKGCPNSADLVWAVGREATMAL